jgi:hypothetical protein
MKKMTMKTYPFKKNNVKPEFIGKSNEVRLRIVDQTCLDKLLLNDSMSLDDYMVLDALQMDYIRSGMVGIKASNYNPRVNANYDTISDDQYILKRKVNDCIACLKSAGNNSFYNITMRMIKDEDLSINDLDFIKINIGGIVKPIKEFYENWRRS